MTAELDRGQGVHGRWEPREGRHAYEERRESQHGVDGHVPHDRTGRCQGGPTGRWAGDACDERQSDERQSPRPAGDPSANRAGPWERRTDAPDRDTDRSDGGNQQHERHGAGELLTADPLDDRRAAQCRRDERGEQHRHREPRVVNAEPRAKCAHGAADRSQTDHADMTRSTSSGLSGVRPDAIGSYGSSTRPVHVNTSDSSAAK